MSTAHQWPRSCGQPLFYNRHCSHCGRAHYNPGKRKLAVRWGVTTRVRVLTGPHAGEMGEVSGVGREYVFVRFSIGTKKSPDYEVFGYLPDQLRRSSGPMAYLP